MSDIISEGITRDGHYVELDALAFISFDNTIVRKGYVHVYPYPIMTFWYQDFNHIDNHSLDIIRFCTGVEDKEFYELKIKTRVYAHATLTT